MSNYVQQRIAEIQAEHAARTAPPKIFDVQKIPPEVLAEYQASGVFCERLYIFKAADYVKVGIAVDPKKRWRQIATANPLLEREYFFTERRFADAPSIERRAHALLEKFRPRNAYCREWFKCDMEIAMEALDEAISQFPESDEEASG
jgi:hypothetical protein